MVPKNSHRPEGGKAAGRAQPGVRDEVSMMPAPVTGSDLGYRNRKESSSSSSYIPLPRATQLEGTEGLSVNTEQRGVTSSAPRRLALQSGRGWDHRYLHHSASYVPHGAKARAGSQAQQLTAHTGGQPAAQLGKCSSCSAHLSIREETGRPGSSHAENSSPH